MIPLKDKDGTILLSLDESRFPLTMETETVYGDRRYVIHLNYMKDEQKQPTDKIKSIHMG